MRKRFNGPPTAKPFAKELNMFKKATLAAAAAAATLVAMPAAAQAQRYDGYNGTRYEQSYRGDRDSQRYDDRYSNRYDDRYSNRYDDRYDGYDNGYSGRSVRYDRNGRRCSGTTGAILGGALGALVGRSIDKSSC